MNKEVNNSRRVVPSATSPTEKARLHEQAWCWPYNAHAHADYGLVHETSAPIIRYPQSTERELALRWGTPLEALSGITRTFVGEQEYATVVGRIPPKVGWLDSLV